MFTKKLGIDLGTTNTLVFVSGQGIVINEPTVVALAKPENKVLAIGSEAKEMVGKTPENIVAYRPLKDGVIADYYITKAMLYYFISKAVASGFFSFKPEVVISVAAGITATEKRAVRKAALEAGAKGVYLVKEPILAALGAGIPINSSEGHMIINLGGGTSEVAVISLGGIVSFVSKRIAGNHFDQAIINYIKKKYNLIIGQRTAEKAKIEVGAALPEQEKVGFKIRGRDLRSSLPKDLIIQRNEIVEAISPYLMEIGQSCREVFNQTPPEIVADVMEKGIILSGGTAQLSKIDGFFRKILGVPVYLAEDPYFCVAKGTSIILEHLDVYKRTLLSKL